MPTATLEQPDVAGSEEFRFLEADSPDNEVEGEADTRLPKPRAKPSPAIDEDIPDLSTEHLGDIEGAISPLIRRSYAQVPERRFIVLQQWEGVVTEVTTSSVWADLCDLTEPSSPVEIVELPLEEISEADMAILALGSVFYWTIGYEQAPGGQRRRVSEVRVRRTPMWSGQVVNSLKEKALELLERFKGDAED